MSGEEFCLYRATVEYDGTDYGGFQIQSNRLTVQGVIETKLSETVGRSVRIVAAGRTDAGVHAVGQVISFAACWSHSDSDLKRALNARLPADIVIRRLEQAPEGFHARYSARSRVYRYSVHNQDDRSPLHRRYAWQVAGSLDLRAMREAAALIVGQHDFGTFGNPTRGDNTVRRVMKAEWAESGSILAFEIEADGFLRRMVRTIVSALLQVGRGWSDEGKIAAMLSRRDRSAAPPPAPACGLCLMQVKY